MATEDIRIRLIADANAAVAPIRRVQQSVQRLNHEVDRSARDMRRWTRGALQQAGYQVGDFYVQVANGTSAMQAFGQQGSQMLGIFGPFGAILGAAVAILSSFAVAAERSSGSTIQLRGILGSLTPVLESISGGFERIKAVLGPIADVIISNIDTMVIAFALWASWVGVKMVAAAIKGAAASGLLARAMVPLRAAVLASALSVGRFSTFLVAFRSVALLASGALAVLRTAFMAVLPIAAIMLIAKAIEMFISLQRGAGSLANAFKLLGDLFQAVISGMVMYGYSFAADFGALVMSIKALWGRGIAWLGDKWADFIEAVVPSLNRISEALNLGPLFDDQGTREWADSLTADVDRAEASVTRLRNAASGMRANAMQGVVDAWSAVSAAIRAGTEEISLFGQASEESLGTASEAARSFREILADTIGESIENGLMSIVKGTKSVADAFREMAIAVIAELYKIYVVQKLVNMVRGFINPTAAPTTGITGARASGGPVTANRAYLVGERGPEIFVPNRNGGIVANGAGGGSGVVVQQTINVSTGVQSTVRSEIKSMMPQIAEASKAAVLDARRRGGTFSAAFG